MNIIEVMKVDVESCLMDDNLNTAAEKMYKGDIGCLPVINQTGQVTGMITDRDICLAAYEQGKLLKDIPVSAAVSNELFFCQLADTVAKAEALMRKHRVRRIPIVDTHGKLLGIVSLDDLALQVQSELVKRSHEITAQEVTATLASVSRKRER